MKHPRYLYVGSRFRLGCSSCYSNAQLPLFSSQAPKWVGTYEALQQIGLSDTWYFFSLVVCFLYVFQALPHVFHFLKECKMVVPGDLCKHLLHKLFLRICLSKCPYVFEVSCCKSQHYSWRKSPNYPGESQTGQEELSHPGQMAHQDTCCKNDQFKVCIYIR
jgi:hypothetical protein